MSLQWVTAGVVLLVEVIILSLISLPTFHSVRLKTVPLLQQCMRFILFVVPFACFQLLDVFWKYEHSMECRGELCTSADRDRFEKSTVKNQRNFLLASFIIFLYWILYRFVKVHAALLQLEAQVRKLKEQ